MERDDTMGRPQASASAGPDDDAFRAYSGPPELMLLLAHTPHFTRIGERIPLCQGESVVGRAPKGGRFPGGEISDQRMSRNHATFFVDCDGSCVVQDGGSTNGTYVNGVRLEGAVGVQPGDILRLGDTILLLENSAQRLCSVGSAQWTGVSWSAHRTRELLQKVARTELNVLLEGEPGTGKETAARLIHDLSGRNAGPFVPVCCSGLAEHAMAATLLGVERVDGLGGAKHSPGLLQEAQHGTLFLEDVEALTAETQARLLRVMESRELWPVGAAVPLPADVRILAATSRGLTRNDRRGDFSAELAQRIKEVAVRLPNLRERRADIPSLLKQLLVESPWQDVVFNSEDIERLMLHSWPANVSELESMVRLLTVHNPQPSPSGHRLTLPWWESLEGECSGDAEETAELRGLGQSGDRPGRRTGGGGAPASGPRLREPSRRRGRMPPISRDELAELLADSQGSIRRVAALLGKHRFQIYRWCERFEVDPDDYR